MSIDSDAVGCYEARGGGYLSPRQFVKAQRKIAQDNGCQVMSSLVVDIRRLDQEELWEVATSDGDKLVSEKLILCQGTYLGLNLLVEKLLPGPLNVWFTAQTVALIEVSINNVVMSQHFDSG